MKIGRRLKHLREDAAYDIEDMAEAMGVKSYTIRRYENDERTPDYDTLVWYAKKFCVTVDYILGYQIPTIFSLDDIPIDYSGWSEPKELQIEYVAAAFVRLIQYQKHIAIVANALRDLIDQSVPKVPEDEEDSSDGEV